MDLIMETMVIYHGGCPDGTSAAWALSLLLDNKTTYYHSGRHKEKYPDIKGKNVIFVDFAYTLEQMLLILQEAKSVLVLDHHATSKNLQFITDPRLTLVLDMNRSGAQIAWDYVSNKLNGSLPSNHLPASLGTNPAGEVSDDYVQIVNSLLLSNRRPWFIDDISDRDLWKWQIPDSKNTTRRMFSMGLYEYINAFYNLIKMDRTLLINEGMILNMDDERIYTNLVRNAVDCVITTLDKKNSWQVRAIECDHSYASEVGNRLVQDGLCDFALMYRYNLVKDEWYISCRASTKSDIDLTKIVVQFDSMAGGHPKAAGMSLHGAESLRNILVPSNKIRVT